MNRVWFYHPRASAAFRKAVLLIIWSCAAVFYNALGVDFFVSPDGTPGGNGTSAAPWDLQTALNHPPIVAPGDVIWLKGGIYRRNNQVTKFASALAGATNQPITVRQFPGERATIDGSILQVNGGWVVYRGFEIMNSYPSRLTSESGSFPTAFQVVSPGGQTNNIAVSGFDLRAPHVKLINLVIHDSIGGGIEVWTNAVDPEIYGTIVFHNGWQGCDRGHGHGLYIQGLEPSNATIANNLFFANYAWGIHATSETAPVDNISCEGNVCFFNGILARKHQGNLLVGPFLGRAKNPVLLHNFVYDRFGNSSDVNIGYVGGSSNAVVLENYFQTSVRFSDQNLGLILASNTFLSGTPSLVRANYTNNTYLSTPPTTNVVEIRTNKYEPGRAHIIVYNWENASSVQVDVSAFLPYETPYEVRSAQDYLGNPLLSGVYFGEQLDLPLTYLPVSKPVGTNAPLPTAPDFNVFILQPSEYSQTPNETPSISYIPDLVTDENMPTETVSFVVSDTETPPEYLNLSVVTTNPGLVPNKNIQISGTGTDRFLTVIPAPDQAGSAAVVVTVSDGRLSSYTYFFVYVAPTESTPTNQIRANLTITLVETNVALSLYGVPNVEYNFRASSNLVNWNFIGTVSTDCEGFGLLIQNDVRNRRQRYYQAVQQSAQ